MVEASSGIVEAHFNGHETAGRRCLALLKDKIYLAALDLAQGRIKTLRNLLRFFDRCKPNFELASASRE